jgi:glycosyltransferase involved in cell wall biosynthesis
MVEVAPAVSIVIPTHQRREALRRALVALSSQTAAPESYEVIVSVDGSTDGSEAMVAAFEAPYALRVTAGPSRGRAAACNSAIELARGEILIVLDDDMQPAPAFVERHRAHHPDGSRLCVMGAVPIELDGSSPHAARYVQEKFNSHLSRLAEPGHEFVPRDFYSGNASLRTEAMRAAGGFSESFTVYGNEDIDLSLRLREAGVELRYDPEALARQEYDKGLAALARDTTEKGRTTVMLARAHPQVFAMLRLASPWDGSRPWLAARSLLLSLTRRAAGLRRLVVAKAVLLERLGLWRQPLFYRAVLDYAFWAGVDAALRESTPEGELDRLARELRRGPIDLLLHR